MQQLKIFGCLLVIMATITSLHCVSVSQIGDVEIYVNETDWKCDKVYCPPEAYMCRVTKQKLEPDAEQVQRVNTCYSKNNEVVAEAINYDPISSTENISLNVTSYRAGSFVSSTNTVGSNFITGNNYNYVTTSGDGGQFDQKQIEDNVNRINAEVEENLRNVNEHIKQQMQDLQDQLRQNLGNLFTGWR